MEISVLLSRASHLGASPGNLSLCNLYGRWLLDIASKMKRSN